MNFWNNLPRPFFVLAPMEDVTDVVFRQVILHAGAIAASNTNPPPAQSTPRRQPDIFFTEFTNAASFCNEKGEVSTRGRLTFAENEQPIVAQIWGKDPENFRQMSHALAEKGFAGIDINMGCPVKDVVKSGGGSALIENPKLAVALIRAAQEGVIASKAKQSIDCHGDGDKSPRNDTAISVKTRLGMRNLDEWRPWLTTLLEQNLANLTVHLRTRKEMSKAPAHFELIPEILNLRDEIAPQTKITINGDIIDRKHALEIWQKTGQKIDGFMIGRGVFANPFCFTDLENPSREQLFELFYFHLDQFDKWREIKVCHPQHNREISTDSNKRSFDFAQDDANHQRILTRRFDPLKRFFKIYVRDFDGAKELREQLFACKTTAEVREILKRTFPPN